MNLPNEIIKLDEAIEMFWEESKKTGNMFAQNLYVWLTTFKACRNTIGLQTPKEVLDLETGIPRCPNCGSFSWMYNNEFTENEVCGRCGQVLIWDINDWYVDDGKYEEIKTL